MLYLLRPAALAGAVALCAAASDAPPGETPPAAAPAAPETRAAAPPATPLPPPAATKPPPAAAKPPSAPPITTEEVDENKVVALLGLAVNAAEAKEVGRIVDVLVDGHGHPRAVVIDVGGFLGMGNRKVAVAWEALRFSLGKNPAAMLSVTSDRLNAAPAYDPSKPVLAVEAPPPPPPPPAKAAANAPAVPKPAAKGP